MDGWEAIFERLACRAESLVGRTGVVYVSAQANKGSNMISEEAARQILDIRITIDVASQPGARDPPTLAVYATCPQYPAVRSE